ncbi:MAG: bis(5'-nucleosyl)-tetraphosphatase (symmetrical) YqeK [Mycoplasmataceae bacterium]|jgi:predicted HD superfamily hydrolase involved in NAD metabolism|nr:bis(5'-nucleosyl)-tetraphosphatase (symmetrical) YqeK [Mycoplasmataceae bacterium]
MLYNVNEIKRKVKSSLSSFRYKHTLAVALYAKKLAIIHGLNQEKAYVAGLLHDYAKELKDSQIIFITKNHPKFSKYPNVRTLHGIASAELAKKEFGIVDHEILDAISQHVIPNKHCSKLVMIIYIADKTDINKTKYSNAINPKQMQKLAASNLRKAFRLTHKLTKR